MEGQQKQYDPETLEAIPLAIKHRELELGDLCEQ